MTGRASPAVQLDAENPWPGLDSFHEDASAFFHGRDHEVATLLRRVLDAPVTTLYGRSGLGKTSLLRAGLFPALRAQHMIPAYVRFDVRPGAVPLAEQLRASVCDAIRANAPDTALPRPDESLWAYLHRAELEFWSPRNYLLSLVIVLDQFEEVFTVGAPVPDLVRAFRNDLGDLVENRIPADLASQIEENADLAAGFDLRARKSRVLISLREDFLPELDGWSRLIPALGRSRLRLRRMRADAALEAVRTSAGDRMTEALAVRIVAIVAGQDLDVGSVPLAPEPDPADSGADPEVEPALLSLFCRELNEERKLRGRDVFDAELVEGGKRDILSNYYESCVHDLPSRVGQFIETELITEGGFRNSFAREDAVPQRLTDDELASLIGARLVRLEERYGAQRIELTHDVLTGVVRDHRDRRRVEEERAALAARAEEELRASEQAAARREAELDGQRRAERERRLEAEARAGRRFRWVAVLLAVVSVLAVCLAFLATRKSASASAAARTAEAASEAAAAARETEAQQRELADHRSDVLTDGIRMRTAVLTGDRTLIDEYLQRGPSQVALTVRADDLGYRSSSGREVFRFTLSPVPSTLPTERGGLASVTYRMDDPSFLNVLYAAGADKQFTASYDGVSCVRRVMVLIEFFDPDRKPELEELDMCAALGWP
jgi:hypothetical protein